MTWLELDSSPKFEDLRLTWLTLMKNSTWLCLDTDWLESLGFSLFLFCANTETLVSFLILCPLPLFDAVCQSSTVAAGSEEERQHGGSSENHHIWIQRLFHDWVILVAVLVKACVCVCVSDIAYRHSLQCAQNHYFKCSQHNYRHTVAATHLFFLCTSATDLLLPQVLCLCLSYCFSRSSAPFERRRRSSMCEGVASEM